MTKYKNDISNKGVSALDSALKLLMDLYKMIRSFIGCLLIDNALRNVVRWYDKRHPHSIKKDSNYSKELAHLNERISFLQITISRLNNSVGVLKSKELTFNNQKETLLTELRKKDHEMSLIIAEKKQMEAQNSELQYDNQNLLRRCLPIKEVPSMIYFAQGDASGLFLRKISTVRTTEHIYRIVTLAGDSLSATFEPVVNNNIQDIINNRNLTLIACEIVRIDPNASSIQVCEAGKVTYENNKWKVINKAKIILS